MSEIIRELSVWKMALLKAFLLCLIAGANTFQTAMAGVEREALTQTQKFLVFNGLFIAVAGALVAFLDKSMQRIAEGKAPLETGTTAFLNKGALVLLLMVFGLTARFGPL